MKQRDILKYALVGALELYTDAKNTGHEQRARVAAADYEKIRDMLFAEIEKTTGPIE